MSQNKINASKICLLNNKGGSILDKISFENTYTFAGIEHYFQENELLLASELNFEDLNHLLIKKIINSLSKEQLNVLLSILNQRNEDFYGQNSSILCDLEDIVSEVFGSSNRQNDLKTKDNIWYLSSLYISLIDNNKNPHFVRLVNNINIINDVFSINFDSYLVEDLIKIITFNHYRNMCTRDSSLCSPIFSKVL